MVLVIDADLRRPRLHAAFGVENKVGLALVLAGKADPTASVQSTSIPGLFVLPSGPSPTNPAELLTSARLKEVLEQFAKVYDFVLVDTPPLLTVTDPCVVVPRVHGVVLGVRNSKNCRPQVEQALETLDTVGANVLGVVINAVGPQFSPTAYGFRNTAHVES
jgi:capsular exopolysaccharide synthesis family protein